MEPEFRLMMVWGVQYIFLITASVCTCTAVHAGAWQREWDIKSAWLLAELE